MDGTVRARIEVEVLDEDRTMERARLLYQLRYGLDFDAETGGDLVSAVEAILSAAVGESDLTQGIVRATVPGRA